MPPFEGLDPNSATGNLALFKSLVDTHPLQELINTEQEYQRYHIGRFNDEKRRTVRSGKKISDSIVLQADGTANRVMPYEEVDVDFTDNVWDFDVPWARFHSATAIDDEDLASNRDGDYADKLLDINKLRRIPVLKAKVRTIEDDIMGSPGSNDTTRWLLGLNYWGPKAPSGTTTSGFNSGAATIGSTTTNTIGGIDQTDADTNDLWKSYNGILDSDAVNDAGQWSDELGLAYTELDFRGPRQTSDMERDNPQMFEMYTGIENIKLFNYFARVASAETGFHFMNGQLAFNEVPIYRSNPYDGDSDRLVKLVNWEQADFYVREGWWFKEYVERDANRPTVMNNHCYTHIQLFFHSRRRGVANVHLAR